MVKKSILLILCIVLALSICAHAAETQTDTSANTPQAQTEMPPQGGRGGMGGRGGPGGGMGMPQEGTRPSEGAPSAPTPPQSATETTDSAVVSDFPTGIPPAPPEMQDGRGMGGGMGGFPGGMMPPTNTAQPTSGTASEPQDLQSFVATYQTPLLSLALLAFGFLFVIFYRRKNF